MIFFSKRKKRSRLTDDLNASRKRPKKGPQKRVIGGREGEIYPQNRDSDIYRLMGWEERERERFLPENTMNSLAVEIPCKCQNSDEKNISGTNSYFLQRGNKVKAIQ